MYLAADLHLFTGEEMDAARVAEVEGAVALEKLWDAALRFTVGRGRAEREVAWRLRHRHADEHQIARVMVRLVAAGLGDEDSNADLRVERLAARGWGSRRIRTEMLSVGFASDTVARAVGEGLAIDHDVLLLTDMVERMGVPATPEERRRMAARLERRGLPPAAVREALRPDEDEQEHRTVAPEAEELIRQVRRRYPTQGIEAAAGRRALSWLVRRGVGPGEARHILAAAAEDEGEGGG